MKILSYVQSLLPSISKDTVLEDLAVTKSILEKTTVPAYETAVECFKGRKFKSKEVLDLFTAINRNVDLGRNSVIEGVHDALPKIIENVDLMIRVAHKLLNEDVSASGFSYKKANILQFIEGITFITKYARKMLVYVFVAETHSAGGSETIRESLTPIEINWITQNSVYFARLLADITGKSASVQAHIDAVPDLVVNQDNAEVLPKTIGEKKTDPFRMGFIPVFLNPIYHVRMAVAEWQAERYNQAVDELELVRLRRMRLEKQVTGQSDAALEKEIDYMERRIQGLEAKIAKMEKQNGD